jgi:hypothetical protein
MEIDVKCGSLAGPSASARTLNRELWRDRAAALAKAGRCPASALSPARGAVMRNENSNLVVSRITV